MFIGPILKALGGTAAVTALTMAAYAKNPLLIKTDKGKVQGKISADGQARDFLVGLACLTYVGG